MAQVGVNCCVKLGTIARTLNLRTSGHRNDIRTVHSSSELFGFLYLFVRGCTVCRFVYIFLVKYNNCVVEMGLFKKFRYLAVANCVLPFRQRVQLTRIANVTLENTSVVNRCYVPLFFSNNCLISCCSYKTYTIF
jgi:hypothetical protein